MSQACWPVPPTLTFNPIRAAIAETPEGPATYTGAKDSPSTTLGEREDSNAGPGTHAGSGVAVGASSGWMSPIEIDVTARCGRPPVWKTPVDAAKFQRNFSAVSLAVTGRSGLDGPPIATRQVGRSPEHLPHRFPEADRFSILLAGVDGCVSSGGFQASPGTPESLAQEAIAAADRLFVRPREIRSACSSGLKRLDFIMPIAGNQAEWPRSPLRLCDSACFQELCGSDGARQDRCREIAAEHHNSARPDHSSGRIVR